MKAAKRRTAKGNGEKMGVEEMIKESEEEIMGMEA